MALPSPLRCKGCPSCRTTNRDGGVAKQGGSLKRNAEIACRSRRTQEACVAPGLTATRATLVGCKSRALRWLSTREPHDLTLKHASATRMRSRMLGGATSVREQHLPKLDSWSELSPIW